jgi:hypothetical protein
LAVLVVMVAVALMGLAVMPIARDLLGLLVGPVVLVVTAVTARWGV